MKSLAWKGAALAAVFGIAASARAGLPVTGGLALWLAADTGVTATPEGLVTAWADQSPAHVDATQSAGGAAPRWSAADANGRPSVHFSGGQFLALSRAPLASQAFTIIAVVRDQRADTNYREILSNWDLASGNTGTSVFFGTTGINPVRFRLSDDFGGAAQGQVGVGGVANPAAFTVLTGINGAGGTAVYQDGVAAATRPTPLSTRNPGGPWTIGRQGTGTFDEYWRGDIAELIVYGRDLSASELAAVWGYLAPRYRTGGPRLSVVPGASGVSVQFTMTPPYAWHVQANNTLAATGWTEVATLPGVTVPKAVELPQGAAGTQRYFRVVAGP